MAACAKNISWYVACRMAHCRLTTVIHFYHCNSADFLREKVNRVEESSLHNSSVPKDIYPQINIRTFLWQSDRHQAAKRKAMLFPGLSNSREIKEFLKHGLKLCQHSAGSPQI